MDAELPNRLDQAEVERLIGACENEGSAWAACVLQHGFDDLECFDREDELADCLVFDDAVSGLYGQVVQDKKDAFGKSLYVENAGLLSVLTLDQVKLLREACPQQDMDEATECFDSVEGFAVILDEFQKLAESVVDGAASEIRAAGGEVNEEELDDNVSNLFFSMPAHTIDGLVLECEQLEPKYEVLETKAEFEALLECIRDEARTDPVANPSYISPERLDKWLKLGRDKIIAKLHEKELQKQQESVKRVLMYLGIVGGIACLLVLLMPLGLRKKHPGKDAILWRSSAVGAGTLALTLALLGGTLWVTKTVQGAVAVETSSPKLRVVAGAFDVLQTDDYVLGLSDLSESGMDFIRGPLRGVVGGSGAAEASEEEYMAFPAYVAEHWANVLLEPEMSYLAKNAQLLEKQVSAFKTILGFFRKIDWVMGYVPILLSILALLLYLLPMKDVLVDIATAPIRAAESGAASGDTVAAASKAMKAEVKSANTPPRRPKQPLSSRM